MARTVSNVFEEDIADEDYGDNDDLETKTSSDFEAQPADLPATSATVHQIAIRGLQHGLT